MRALAMNPDYLGADGGKLAVAFASGCIATFAFMSTIGAFIWKLAGKDRIEEVKAALAAEKLRCAEMETRMVDRIQQLETILLFETVGGLRQDAAKALAEIHDRYRGRIAESGEEQS